MVEYSLQLDSVFGSLADATRRDILQRVARSELSVSEIANAYDMSLAAVSKHLKILEKAKLVVKRRKGKQQLVQAAPTALQQATSYLEQYGAMMAGHLDSLEMYLINEEAVWPKRSSK